MVVGIKVNRANDNIVESQNNNITPKCVDKLYSYEEAITLAGHGAYSRRLLLLLSLALLAMGLDMFGFSVAVAGCGCELQLTHRQRGILNSMPFAGPILMSYAWGYISDTMGRRRSLLAAMLGAFSCSALSALAPNWIVLGVMKLIGTSFVSCAQSSTYALLGESCSERVRGSYMLLMTSVLHTTPFFYFLLGYFVLGLESSYDLGFIQFTPWRLYSLLLSLAPLLGFFSMLLLVESPKFLANQGREAEALRCLEKIWTINGGEPNMYPVKSLILEENTMNKSVSLAESLRDQTVPLFKPPYLKHTLILYYIVAVVYGSSNSLITWLPYISNAYFGPKRTSMTSVGGLCDVLSAGNVDNSYSRNITDFFEPQCSSKLETNTLFAGAALGLLFSTINYGVSFASSRKKLITIVTFLLATCGSVGVMLSTQALLVVPFYVMAALACLGNGLVSSYYVLLFPTSYRGMAACLGVVAARLSALAGVNLLAAGMHSTCHLTFAALGLFIFCE
ncbi:synaptic vesicle 2-related protein-like [Plutella xylostella]|uniref:synaptic vesicle 2-related protein-like n=1 Tax=Plutella xylostella TaxID=51655 RepID=UPI002032DCC3|nr:synaptic vesicle 2-related protein-like [Plutella xylostella]